MNDVKALQIELKKEIVRVEDIFRSRYPNATAETMSGLLMFGPHPGPGDTLRLRGDALYVLRYRSDLSKTWAQLSSVSLAEQARAVYSIGELDARLAQAFEKLTQDLQGSVEFIKKIHPNT